MSSRQAHFDWQIVNDGDDEGWKRLVAHHIGDPARRVRGWRDRYLNLTTLFLVGTLLAAMAFFVRLYWLAEQEVAEVETELRHTLDLEQWAQEQETQAFSTRLIDDQAAADWRWRMTSESQKGALPFGPQPEAEEIEVEEVQLRDRLALVKVRITVNYGQLGTRSFRAVRFYRETPDGWVRTEPNAAFMGAPRVMESERFIVHFRSRELNAVLAVLPRLDQVYGTIRTNYGLPDQGEKVAVELALADTPFAPTSRVISGQWVVVASPSLLPAPVDYSEEEILYQSVVTSLVDRVRRESRPFHLQPMDSAIALWQLYAAGGLLGAQRDSLVALTMIPDQTNGKNESPNALARVDHCYLYWLLDRTYSASALDHACLLQPRSGPPSTSLSGNLSGLIDGPDFPPDPTGDLYEAGAFGPRPYSALVWELLVSYGVQTYGPGRLPALSSALRDGKAWVDIVPAVYGVPWEKFQAEWFAWLGDQYGLSIEADL
ncbi:MAG: hypothetical protein HC802_07135 [Caldilineaceae bacterium]|nr:hypothetical protein [Caldilineaceae bacterium]